LIEPYIPAWRLPWIEQMDEMAREFRARLDAMKDSKEQTGKKKHFVKSS